MPPQESIYNQKERVFTTGNSIEVFISYRHQEPDSSLAREFSHALKQAGHQVFIDTGIRWGANWVKTIRGALDRSSYLLLLLSQEATVSEMVVEEVEIACELAQKRNGFPIILPIRIQLPFEESIPYLLSARLRAVQQEHWKNSRDTPRLIEQLLTTISERVGWHEGIPQQHRSVQASSIQNNSPQPFFDPRELITPGGALEADSKLYITRTADTTVLDEIQQSRAIITVLGPRQTGKTSLISRAYSVMKKEGNTRAAFFDFQSCTHENFQSLDSIWNIIAAQIGDQLQIDEPNSWSWDSRRSYDRNISRFLSECVFAEDETPLLLCLDEVDRVFRFPVNSQFFSSVRSFYNRGARDMAWRKVRWIMATSTEPHFFIENISESPFNVGLRVKLNNFNADEVAALTRRYGINVDNRLLGKIMYYLGGQPYLVHLLLHHLVRHVDISDDFFSLHTTEGNLFRDHLHHFLIHFQREKSLCEAMIDIIDGRECKDAKLISRLEAAGLVTRAEKQTIVPSCQLYAQFFSTELR